jgi:SanA protein
LKYGVPPENIYLDYAGFRTLDSMVRSKIVFGEDSVIVVSQKFHNQRAVFIAHINDTEAVGFNAAGITPGIKMQVREIFARVKVFIDLAFQIKPRHLGEKINLGKESVKEE